MIGGYVVVRVDGRGARAFTLVEMLVVIAIIAILSSMVAGGILRALDISRSSSCTNLLKQYTVASLMYAENNGGMMIDCYNYLSTSGGLPQYLANSDVVTADYARCPGDQNTESAGRLGELNTFAGIKVSIGGFENTLSCSLRPTSVGPKAFWIKLNQIKSPGKAGLWADYQNTVGGSVSAPIVKPAASSLNTMVFRHGDNGSNLAYADGHVGKVTVLLPVNSNGHNLNSGINWTVTATAQLYKAYYPFFGPASAPVAEAYGNWPDFIYE